MIKSIIPLLIIFIFNFFGEPYEVTVATPSAILEIPEKIASSSTAPRNDITPWGTTDKIGDHLYRTYVGNDQTMGTPDEILKALNLYRQNHNVGQLATDDKLCRLAQQRADAQSSGLDSHKGLSEYMNNPDSWDQLGITSIGENASFGYVLSGVHLIEWVFNADEEHRNNQLNPNWTFACAGISGSTVDIIFAKR